MRSSHAGRHCFGALALRLAAAVLLAVSTGQPQTVLTLEEAGRRGPSGAPLYEGQQVLIQGTVSARPLLVGSDQLMPIQTEALDGILVETSDGRFRNRAPGDVIEVIGTVLSRAGTPILAPASHRLLRKTTPPEPKAVALTDVVAGRYLGVFVRVEGNVVGSSGRGRVESLQVGTGGLPVQVTFARRTGGDLGGYRLGDRVSVEGVPIQLASSQQPGDHEIAVPSAAGVQLIERSWLVPLQLLLAGVLLVLVAALAWYVRERRNAAQRKLMRSLNMLGEDAISARTPGELLDRCTAVLPPVLGCSTVHLYLHQRASHSLERLAGSAPVGPHSLDLDAPVGPLAHSIALCFRNRSLLLVRDTRRSPLFRAAGDAPRTVLLVPMIAQEELLGVLEATHADRPRGYSRDELSAMQHLANQLALALRLQEQQSVREQLFRSEKLAAAGQLISGVAKELRSPLDTVVGLVGRLLHQPEAMAISHDLRAIEREAQQATDIVGRLLSFTASSRAQATRIDLHRLVSGLAEFRQREWRTLGIQSTLLFSAVPVHAVGVQGQVEQVVLALLVHAEQCLADSPERLITLSVQSGADRAVVSVTYSLANSENAPDPFDGDAGTEGGPLGLGLCRGLIQSQGGELRFDPGLPQGPRFEVELPLAQAAADAATRSEARAKVRPLTLLAVEPEPVLQRQLLMMLSDGGHRVVVLPNGEEALDLLRRTRFDATLCAVRLPGMGWTSLRDQCRDSCGLFVVLADAQDAELARSVRQRDALLLRKPVELDELNAVLSGVEPVRGRADALRAG